MSKLRSCEDLGVCQFKGCPNCPNKRRVMNELALFSGAGGGILGGHLLGWRTVCAVEWEEYPASVLCARQNDKVLPTFPIWDDVRTFDGRPWRRIVDVVSGGFPCQDISAAGRGAGITGEKSSMWKHMARIISQVRPQYAFVENSPMLTVRGLGVVLGDLSEMGYDCRWGVVSAADIGANHRRDRIWIVGKVTNPKCIRLQESTDISKLESKGCSQFQTQQSRDSSHLANPHSVSGGSLEVRRSSVDGSEECGDIRGISAIDKGNEQKETREILADSTNIGQQGQGEFEQSLCSEESGDWKTNLLESIGRPEFWSVEPHVGRVADGVAARVDRLKAIGNGQVPLCAATAWKLLTSDLKV
jgi:DNA (cytosine-5)-methyltransferase 1